MNENPLISIIIPLYNKADTIERTLRSVAKQTYRNFEVVVVDDGSEDGGSEIVSRFTSIDAIRLVKQENAGVSAARNFGAQLANGKYVVFLDADDEYHPDFLTEQLTLINMFPECNVYCTGFTYDVNAPNGPSDGDDPYERKRISIFTDCIGCYPFNICTELIRKSAFEEVSGFVPGHNHFEDIELTFKLAQKKITFAFSSRKMIVVHTDANERLSIKQTGYDEYHHWKWLETEGLVRMPEIARYAATELMRTLVYNYRRGNFSGSNEITTLFPRLFKTTGIIGRILLKRNPIGYLIAKTLKKRLRG